MIFTEIILLNENDITTLFTTIKKNAAQLQTHIKLKEKCLGSSADYEMYKANTIGDTLLDHTGDFVVEKLVGLDAYLTELIKSDFIFYLKSSIEDMDEKKRKFCSRFSNYCVSAGIHQEEMAMAMMLRLINVDPLPNYKKFKRILNALED